MRGPSCNFGAKFYRQKRCTRSVPAYLKATVFSCYVFTSPQFVDIFVILINDKKLMRLLNETLEFLTICFINNVVVKVIQLV